MMSAAMADLGSKSKSRSRSRSRGRDSRKKRSRAASSSSSSSSDDDLYYKPFKTAYKLAHKTREKELAKKRKGASLLNTPKGQLALMQGINIADRVRTMKDKVGATEDPIGDAYAVKDRVFEDIGDDANWDDLKDAAKKVFRASKVPIKVVTDFQYLLATMDDSEETDQALSRIFDVSRDEYATPMGKLILAELIKTVEGLRPGLKRTIKALQALYRPQRAALRKAAKGGKRAGMYLARAEALGDDKTFDKAPTHSSARVKLIT
jgi:hypothetical protein